MYPCPLCLLTVLVLPAGAAMVGEISPLTKTVEAPGPFQVGEVITWNVTVRNHNLTDLSNLTLLENITGLSGLGTLIATPSQGSWDMGNLTWSIPVLPANTSAFLLLDTTFTTPGNKTNQITVTAVTPSDSFIGLTDSMTIPVRAPFANLSLTKTVDGTGPYRVGDLITWNVTVRNHNATGLANLTLLEDVSGLSGLNLVTVTPSQGSWDLGNLTWTIPSLAPNEGAYLTLATTFNSTGNQTNRVVVTAVTPADSLVGMEAMKTITVTTPPVQANVSLTKTVDGTGPYRVGDVITWHVSVRNHNATGIANLILMEDIAGLTGLNLSTLIVTPSLGTWDPANLTWSITDLPVNTSAFLRLNTTFDTPGDKTNRVVITAAVPADSIIGIEATKTITVTTPPVPANLTLTKTVDTPGPYFVGDSVTWNVTVRNHNVTAFTNLTLVEDLSGFSGFNLSTVTPSLGSWDMGNLTWSIPALAQNETAYLRLVTTFFTSGDKTNRIVITAAAPAESILGMEATKTITVRTPPVPVNVSLTKAVETPGPYFVDDPVTWRVTLENRNVTELTNVTLREDLSGLTGLEDLMVTPSTGSWDPANFTWSIPVLLPNTTARLTLITTFDTPGNKTNRVEILNATPSDSIVGMEASATITVETRPVLEVEVRIEPETLNLRSHGVFTAFITFPSGSLTRETEVEEITCAGASSIRSPTVAGQTLIVKFARQDFEGIEPGDSVSLTCTGTLETEDGDQPFQGSDTIRVIGMVTEDSGKKGGNPNGDTDSSKNRSPSVSPGKDSSPAKGDGNGVDPGASSGSKDSEGSSSGGSEKGGSSSKGNAHGHTKNK
jgi:conserved repeat domain